MRDTIEMAGEVWQSGTGRYTGTASIGELKRFEALVRADERERIADESKHIIKRAEARGAAVEREACAKVCETEWSTTQEHVYGLALADMIRARGETK
jgi:hypothetical protein